MVPLCLGVVVSCCRSPSGHGLLVVVYYFFLSFVSALVNLYTRTKPKNSWPSRTNLYILCSILTLFGIEGQRKFYNFDPNASEPC